MKSLAVIKHGNIFQYILLCFMACLVVTPLHSLLLQATKKAFGNGIIPAITFATYAAFKAIYVT